MSNHNELDRQSQFDIAEAEYKKFLIDYEEDSTLLAYSEILKHIDNYAKTKDGYERIVEDYNKATDSGDFYLGNILKIALEKATQMASKEVIDPADSVYESNNALISTSKSDRVRVSPVRVKLNCAACGNLIGSRTYRYRGNDVCRRCFQVGACNSDGKSGYQPQANPSTQTMAQDFVALIKEAVVNRSSNGREHSNGDAALNNLIRSQLLIKNFHKQVAGLFVGAGSDPALIKYEARLQTTRQGKDVDVVIYDERDDYWSTERSLAIFCKSSVSSGGKNYKNMINGSGGDASELHRHFPRQVVGLAHVMMVYEVDRNESKEDRLSWVQAPSVARSISWYQEVNGRLEDSPYGDSFERVGSLIIDPRNGGKVIETIDGLLASGATTAEDLEAFGVTSLDGFTMQSYAEDLIAIQRERFPLV